MNTKNFGIRELAERAKKEGAFDLAQGVIDSHPPEILLETLRSLPLEKYSTYNNKRGVPEFRQAIVDYLNSRSWNVQLDQVAAISGVVAGITTSLLTYCRPGDTVLLPEPFFIGHKLLLESLGFNIRFISLPLTEEPDWNEIGDQMKDAKALILTTPANPTGYVASREILAMLSKRAVEHKCLLVIDEIYREFHWDETTPSDKDYENIDLTYSVILRSFSKTLCIPGWRVGFAVMSPDRLEQFATVHDSLYLGGSTLGQFALANSLTSHREVIQQYIQELRVQLQKNKDMFLTAFPKVGMNPLEPKGAYYMLIEHKRSSDMDAMEELIQKKIVTTPLNILYSDSTKNTGYIRAHFGVAPETAQKVADILTAS